MPFAFYLDCVSVRAPYSAAQVAVCQNGSCSFRSKLFRAREAVNAVLLEFPEADEMRDRRVPPSFAVPTSQLPSMSPPSRGKLWTPNLSQDASTAKIVNGECPLNCPQNAVRGALNRPRSLARCPVALGSSAVPNGMLLACARSLWLAWSQRLVPLSVSVRSECSRLACPDPPRPSCATFPDFSTPSAPADWLFAPPMSASFLMRDLRVPNTATGCVHNSRRRVARCLSEPAVGRCKIVESLGTKSGAKPSNVTLHASNSGLGQAPSPDAAANRACRFRCLGTTSSLALPFACVMHPVFSAFCDPVFL